MPRLFDARGADAALERPVESRARQNLPAPRRRSAVAGAATSSPARLARSFGELPGLAAQPPRARTGGRAASATSAFRGTGTAPRTRRTPFPPPPPPSSVRPSASTALLGAALTGPAINRPHRRKMEDAEPHEGEGGLVSASRLFPHPCEVRPGGQADPKAWGSSPACRCGCGAERPRRRLAGRTRAPPCWSRLLHLLRPELAAVHAAWACTEGPQLVSGTKRNRGSGNYVCLLLPGQPVRTTFPGQSRPAEIPTGSGPAPSALALLRVS